MVCKLRKFNLKPSQKKTLVLPTRALVHVIHFGFIFLFRSMFWGGEVTGKVISK